MVVRAKIMYIRVRTKHGGFRTIRSIRPCPFDFPAHYWEHRTINILPPN
jgi:hypothetical protein